MRIVIRADASADIGTGHVMRCLTLASALRERDAAVSFVCREHDGHFCDLLEGRGFSVSRLPAPSAGNQTDSAPAHAAWLGVSWQEDADQSRAAIEVSGSKPDCLVVDHYALDQRWESALRKSAGSIMVIDDLADRVHDCDLLLDQNLVAQMHTRYADKVSVACGKLLGPEYALLQPIYAELHDRIAPREGTIRRIFIFFGGADSDDLTGCALAALLRLNRPDIEIDVVIADRSPHAESIRQQTTGHSNIHLYRGLQTLAPLMVKADLAIGGAGATSWERLCLGLYAVVVAIADNQEQAAAYLGERGLISYLGRGNSITAEDFVFVLEKIISEGCRSDVSAKVLNLVDGLGATRVVHEIAKLTG